LFRTVRRLENCNRRGRFYDHHATCLRVMLSSYRICIDLLPELKLFSAFMDAVMSAMDPLLNLPGAAGKYKNTWLYVGRPCHQLVKTPSLRRDHFITENIWLCSTSSLGHPSLLPGLPLSFHFLPCLWCRYIMC
jgi:hypothetical protein